MATQTGKTIMTESNTRDSTRATDVSGRICDEIIKLLMKLQTQEHATAEKVLEGQGDIVRQRIKEIDDKYATMCGTLRTMKDLMVQAKPMDQMKADLEKREAVLQSSRTEVEKTQAGIAQREAELARREKELEERLASADHARKEKELQEQQADFETRLAAFQEEYAALEKNRKNVEREWEKLTVQRGSLTQDIVEREKQIEESQDRLNAEMKSYRKRIEEEVFIAIQKSIVDLLKSHYREESGP